VDRVVGSVDYSLYSWRSVVFLVGYHVRYCSTNQCSLSLLVFVMDVTLLDVVR